MLTTNCVNSNLVCDTLLDPSSLSCLLPSQSLWFCVKFEPVKQLYMMRQAMKSVTVVLVCVVQLCVVAAYPTGAPKCTLSAPKHEDNKAQTSKAPYKVEASAVSMKDGKSTITVTISGMDGAKFKGFMLFATSTDAATTKIGTFTKVDKTKLVTCESANVLTHSDNKDKKSISATWTAPADFSGKVEFKAMVVKQFKEFWTGLKSASVKV